MLHLERITRQNEFLKCNASGEILMFGDFYYRDDEDGKVISAKYYQTLKQQKREENWDYSLLNQASSQKEYQDMLREKEMELFSGDVLKRAVFGKESDNAAKGF